MSKPDDSVWLNSHQELLGGNTPNPINSPAIFTPVNQGRFRFGVVIEECTEAAEVRFIYPSAVFYFNCEKSQFTQTVVMPGSHRKGELPVKQNQEWKLFG